MGKNVFLLALAFSAQPTTMAFHNIHSSPVKFSVIRHPAQGRRSLSHRSLTHPTGHNKLDQAVPQRLSSLNEDNVSQTVPIVRKKNMVAQLTRLKTFSHEVLKHSAKDICAVGGALNSAIFRVSTAALITPVEHLRSRQPKRRTQEPVTKLDMLKVLLELGIIPMIVASSTLIYTNFIFSHLRPISKYLLPYEMIKTGYLHVLEQNNSIESP